tara:strand:+ start:6689 stop:10399 length:3711 start_codon:yes stop_codon:yes gene_type:complete
MSNKIFSTADSSFAYSTNARHYGVPIEIEPGWILQLSCNTSSAFSTVDYPVDVATGAIGTVTNNVVAGISPENNGIILTDSVLFDSTHMLSVFQDATSGNINAMICEWDPATHTHTSHTVTDLGITGGGFCVNMEKIDATHYLISYDSGTDLVQQVIEVNAGTYAVSTVGTPLVTGTTNEAPQCHVVQIDSTHYSVSYTKKSPGTSGHFMIVEVNLSTWAVTTATAATDLGGGAATGAYMTSFYIDAVTWTFKVSATKVVVFYNRLDGSNFISCYRVVDINTGTWAITVGSLQDFQAAGQYMFAAYLTQKDLTVAEAHYSCNVESYMGQSMFKIGFDAVNNLVTVISNSYNTWVNTSYIRYSPMGHVTEMNGGDILVVNYKMTAGSYPHIYSIFNADPPTAGGSIKPIASGMIFGIGTSREFPCVISLDSTHFVALGLVGNQPFRSYLIDAAGQIQNLHNSSTVNYSGSVSGVKLDSTHMLLSADQYKFRVAEVNASYIGSWSAAETSLSSGGTDFDNGVKMYIAGEDASYYYVIVNRYSTGTTTAVSVVSVDKATWVVAQVGSDLTGMGNADGYDMTPIQGYTNKWLCVYQNTNLKAIVVGVNGSFEPVLEGAEFDFGFVGDFPNVQSIDATHAVVTYSDVLNDGFALTVEVNTGTWAVSLASAAAFEFETSYLNIEKTRLVKLDDNHVGILWGAYNSANYVNHQAQCKLAVLEMDASTYNLSESQGINLIAFEGSSSSLSLLDSSTVVSTTIPNNAGGSNSTANIQLWEVSAGSVTPTQVVITAAGVDFTAGASTTLEVQVQDAGGIVDGSDNTTQITFTPTSQGQITGVVTGTNISGTGAVGNPRVVQVAAGVAKITIENSTIETFEIATTNSAGLTNPANDSITTSAGAATKVVFTQDPTSAVAGVDFSPTITAEIQDAYNNVVNSTANVVLSINTGTGTLNGTTTVAAVAGVATFNNININEAGNFTLDVDSTGLATDTSPTFTISPAAASTVALTTSAPDFVAGGSTSLGIQIRDAFGNIVSSDSTTHVTFSPTLSGAVTGVTVGTNVSGTGLPGDPRTVQVAAGRANIVLQDTVAETFEVAFSNNQNLSNPANDSIIVSAAAATKVSLTGAGSNFTVGGNTTVSVQVQDTYNNLITTDNTTQITYTPTSNGQIPSVSVGTNISGTGAVGDPRVVQVAGGQAAVVVTNLVVETFEIAFTNSGGYTDPANDSIDSLAVVVNGAGVMVGFNF